MIFKRTSCFQTQDDANNDPQWSEEQLLEAKFSLAGLTIGRCEVDIMNRSTVAIFEILEKAWATQNCTLVDMKVHTAPCWLNSWLTFDLCSYCEIFDPFFFFRLSLEST